MEFPLSHFKSDFTSHLDPSHLAYFGTHPLVSWQFVDVTMHQRQHYCDVTEGGTIANHWQWGFGWRCCQNRNHRTHNDILMYTLLTETHTHTHKLLNKHVRGTQDISSQQPKSLEISPRDLASKSSKSLRVQIENGQATLRQIPCDLGFKIRNRKRALVCVKHIESQTKFQPFYWRYFQTHFHDWKLLYFDQISLKFIPKG